MNDTTQQLPILVFGEGSASIYLIAQLIKRNESIVWVKESGSQVWPVMPYVKSELALGALIDSHQAVCNEVFASPIEKGTAHRVFRNKGFKMPSWKRSSNLEAQQQAFEEMVWTPEQAYLGVTELRIAGMSTMKIEQDIRAAIELSPLVKKIEMAPVVEFEVFEHGGKVQFSNGVITEFRQLFYCGPLAELKAIPKLPTVLKHQVAKAKSNSAVSVLQVMFKHSEPLLQTIETGLVIPMNRDSGETFDRDALGYFVDSTHSIWSVFLQADEIEENHEIMKKLRKMKQSLNKAFDSPDFLPNGRKDFMATVEKEQVRFEAGFLVIEGEYKTSTANSDYVLLNDSFGLSYALEQIANRFEIPALEFNMDVIESEHVEMDESNELLENIQSIAAAPQADAQF
jgi:hypothetical protein